MSKVHVYPRGFMSGERNDDVEELLTAVGRPSVTQVEGDPIIMALFNEYMSKSYIRNSADFQLQVIKRLLQLTGPFNTWMERQVNRNRYCYDQNYEFLMDTFKFIHTGRRSISNLLTWYQLLSEYPEPEVGITQDRWNSILRKTSSNPTEDLLAKWISYPTGLDDIMMSAFIFFGDGKTARNVIPQAMN